MAKRAAISKEIKRTIRLKFLTERGKIYTISLNCASAKLAGDEGAALVKRVMEGILQYDVFTVKLVKAVGAELVERRVILTAEDFQNGETHTEIGGAPRTLGVGAARFDAPLSSGGDNSPEPGGSDLLMCGYYAFKSRLQAAHSFHTVNETLPDAGAPPPTCVTDTG